MKYLFLLTLLVSIIGYSQGQHANAVFFSENGEKFTVIMNGLRQNKEPETNVKVTGLNEAPYKVKIIFADTALGVIDDKISLLNYKERTYVVKNQTITSASKGLKKVGVNLGRQLKAGDKEEAAKEKAAIDSTNSKYVLKALSETSVGEPPVQNNSQAQPARSSNVSGSATTTTTTNQSASGSGKGSKGGTNANMNVGANDGNGQFSMNVNINANDSHQSSHSTTSTTTSTNTTHYVMPGYGGPVGCPWPMSPGDFASAKNSINSKSFEDSKLTVAKQIIGSNCLISDQVKEIMLLFSFEETRLDFAKFAYGYTYDTGNYFKVNDAFTFETSIEDLNRYIQSR